MNPRRPAATASVRTPFYSIALAIIIFCLTIPCLFLFIGGNKSKHTNNIITTTTHHHHHPLWQQHVEEEGEVNRHIPRQSPEKLLLDSTVDIALQRDPRRSMMNNNNNFKRNMVGGYSANMDVKTIQSDSQMTEVAKFALHEYLFSASSPIYNLNTVDSVQDSSSSSSSSSFVITPEEWEAGAVQIKVLEAQTQVVAGLNYKLTLSIQDRSNNCHGFLQGIVIYKPLPHTGQGLSITSWGKFIKDCTTADEKLLKLLNESMSIEEKSKENAWTVEDSMEEKWEEVEPNT